MICRFAGAKNRCPLVELFFKLKEMPKYLQCLTKTEL